MKQVSIRFAPLFLGAFLLAGSLEARVEDHSARPSLKKDFERASRLRLGDKNQDYASWPFVRIWKEYQNNPNDQKVRQAYQNERLKRLQENNLVSSVWKYFHKAFYRNEAQRMQARDFALIFTEGTQHHSSLAGYSKKQADDEKGIRSLVRAAIAMTPEELKEAREQILADEAKVKKEADSQKKKEKLAFLKLAMNVVDESLHLRGVKTGTQQNPDTESGKIRKMVKEIRDKDKQTIAKLDATMEAAAKGNSQAKETIAKRFKNTLLSYAARLWETGKQSKALTALKAISSPCASNPAKFCVAVTHYASGQPLVMNLGSNLEKAFQSTRNLWSSYVLRPGAIAKGAPKAGAHGKGPIAKAGANNPKTRGALKTLSRGGSSSPSAKQPGARGGSSKAPGGQASGGSAPSADNTAVDGDNGTSFVSHQDTPRDTNSGTVSSGGTPAVVGRCLSCHNTGRYASRKSIPHSASSLKSKSNSDVIADMCGRLSPACSSDEAAALNRWVNGSI